MICIVFYTKNLIGKKNRTSVDREKNFTELKTLIVSKSEALTPYTYLYNYQGKMDFFLGCFCFSLESLDDLAPFLSSVVLASSDGGASFSCWGAVRGPYISPASHAIGKRATGRSQVAVNTTPFPEEIIIIFQSNAHDFVNA
jgi:hypothetical protein